MNIPGLFNKEGTVVERIIPHSRMSPISFAM